MENVLLLTFPQRTQAYLAMSELRNLDDQGPIDVRSAVVVERLPNGQFLIPDAAENIRFTGTAVGGGLGALVGALVGPLGILLGGALGMAVGSITDVDDADTTQILLTSVSRRVPTGATALLADIDETDTAVVDTAAAGLDATVLRWPRSEVEAELASSTEALRSAQAEAQRVLRQRRKAQGNETVRDRIDDLKEKVTGSDS